MRNQGPLKSSCNAGELSPDLYAKVGLKQYYSGARKMKNIEPVPQSGCRLGPGSAWVAAAASDTCRMFCLKVADGKSFILVFTDGQVKIYRAETRALVFTIASATITAARLPGYDFYGEANTVGVFHADDNAGIRIFRNTDTDWTIGAWPYASKPKVDLGGTYTKTSDKWEIYIRFTADTPRLVVQMEVDGEMTEAVPLVNDGTTNRIAPNDATGADRTNFALDLQAALRALPSMTNDLTVEYRSGESLDKYWIYRVEWAGDLRGVTYQFNANVVNTSTGSALVAHIQEGETQYEPLISATQGGFAGMAMFQDRACYYGPRARAAAIAMSQTGEYFELDITRAGDAQPRLEALRTETSQTILHLCEDAYLLVFTDQAEWFINNRVIKQSEPLNFVLASEIGTRKGVKPQKFDGRTWFISRDGSSLYTIRYDAVGENFQPNQEDMLATHLVNHIKRQWVQRKISGSSTPRLWELRDDGRLVCAVVIEQQQIAGFFEWISAGDGFVVDIEPDGADQLWMVVRRGTALSIEVMEEASQNLFQSSLTVTTDLAGLATGLSIFNGREVWARIDGYVDGPYTVASGQVQFDPSFAGKSATIGLWQPPLFESMPYYRVLPDDEVLMRPARVHTVSATLIDTESIAIGANGRPAKNVPLARAGDDLSAAPQPFNGEIEVAGIMGATVGPVVTITQTRPGLLRLRDYLPGVKF